MRQFVRRCFDCFFDADCKFAISEEWDARPLFQLALLVYMTIHFKYLSRMLVKQNLTNFSVIDFSISLDVVESPNSKCNSK